MLWWNELPRALYSIPRACVETESVATFQLLTLNKQCSQMEYCQLIAVLLSVTWLVHFCVIINRCINVVSLNYILVFCDFLNRYTLEDHSELKIGDELCSGSKLNFKRCCLQPQLAVVPKNGFVYTRDMWSSIALNAETSHLDSVL